jgi:hypothetical protein
MNSNNLLKYKSTVTEIVKISVIMLFQDEITVVFLNSSLSFQIYNQNNISTIQNNITFSLYSC